MEIMYIKYVNNQRHSIIKEGENIMITNSKINSFDSVKKITKNEYTPYLNTQKHTNLNSIDKIDEEITNFFFDAIHKNYLLGKSKQITD